MITRRSTRRTHPKDSSNAENNKESINVVPKQESVVEDDTLPKRIKELEDSIIELRKLWLAAKNDLDTYDNNILKSKTSTSTSISTTATTSISTATTTTTSSNTLNTSTTTRTSSKVNTSVSSESDKPQIRALTRRESSRKNLENTLSTLCKEAAEIKAINLFAKPSQEPERENYDKYIFKHKDMSIINERVGGSVEDAYTVMNDLLLMFQNAIMFYPPGHKIYKLAIELRDKMVPQWEKALIERFKFKH